MDKNHYTLCLIIDDKASHPKLSILNRKQIFLLHTSKKNILVYIIITLQFKENPRRFGNNNTFIGINNFVSPSFIVYKHSYLY